MKKVIYERYKNVTGGLKVTFDCGEMGWSYFHASHIKYMKKVVNDCLPPARMGTYQVWTFPEREKLYRGFADEICHLPDEIMSKDIIRNGFDILKWDGVINPVNRINKVMGGLGIDPSSLAHKFKLPRGVKPYEGQMLFEPYETTAGEQRDYLSYCKNRKLKNIVLFPRLKTGFPYYDKRNWPGDNWKDLIAKLLKNTYFNIILCGNKDDTHPFKHKEARIINLTESEDPLASTIAALNDKQTILSVSTQSFGPTLSLLQNQNVLVWGHDKARLENDVGFSYRYTKRLKYNFIEGDINIYANITPDFVLQEILKMTST